VARKSQLDLCKVAGVDNLRAQSIEGGPKKVTNFTDNSIFAFDWSRDENLVASRAIITSDVVLISDALRSFKALASWAVWIIQPFRPQYQVTKRR